ncbi:dihydrosphingosine 1-phosphate phosphatase [Ceratobasidium sp. AG-Ba]|nr:dihydrosphingosine 1-phosphate phosphatase [Ceratobasidium sp. AG-Ba]
MRLSSTVIASLFGFTSLVAGAIVTPPQFKHLLTGTIITSPSENSSFIVSPYGHRLTAAGYLGGNWTLPNGSKIADVYPNVGGDSGIQDNTGTLHVDTRMTWKLDDGSYVWMHALGQGVAYVSDDLYIELETDSKKYSWLNNKYFIGVGTFNGAIWTINLFGHVTRRESVFGEPSAAILLWITTAKMTPAPSPPHSPAPLPFAPARSRVKFDLEDTVISPLPSPLPSSHSSDTGATSDDAANRHGSDGLGDGKILQRPHFPTRVDSAEDAPGTLPDEFYDAAMTPWRAAVRRRLVKNLKVESEWIGNMQRKIRHPFLDTYFVYTSSLGTHTFFMIVLPTFFFFGYPMVGIGLLHVLAAGVYFSSLIKDLICSPRPFEPTVTRLTVGTHHLEYGFPSTHSTNSVSIALYIHSLAAAGFASSSIAPSTYYAIQTLLAVYAFSIVFGRLYCAMHSFTDCAAGVAIGTAIWAAQMQWGNAIDTWITQNGWMVPIAVLSAGLFLVHRHAEPVDDCPCFEDAIAFVSVVMGVMVARWHFAQFILAPSDLSGFSDYFLSRTPGSSFTTTTDVITFALYASLKMVVGIAAIFIWRIVAKRVCLTILPPIFRLFSREVGPLPTRRWYTPATDYSTVPADVAHLRTVPSVIDLPSKVSVASTGVLPRTHIYRVADGAEAKQRVGKGGIEKRGLQMVDRQTTPGEIGIREQKVKHYDADVLTKVVVYMGIGIIASGMAPILFEKLDWGVMN